MWTRNGLVCLLKRHIFRDTTKAGSLYRRCQRCGRTEMKHYHPRFRNQDVGAGVPVAVQVEARDRVWTRF